MTQDQHALRHDDYERHRAETIFRRRHVTSHDVMSRRRVRRTSSTVVSSVDVT